MTELQELELIERQMNIDIALEKMKESTSIAKEHIMKHLSFLYSVIEKALEWDIRAINYIANLWTTELVYPEKYIDEEWNIYEVKWINESQLNYQWKLFDERYKGSMKIWHYLMAFQRHLREYGWYRNFTIKLLNPKKK